MYERIETGRDAEGRLHVVGLSGGKDSTAMSLRLVERNPGIDYTFFCTPTGDELPEMLEHWRKLEVLLGKPIVQVRAKQTLNQMIDSGRGIPNWRMRWCTRTLKIYEALAFYAINAPCVAYIGLRADEEAREGLYGSDVPQVYPMREWGWGIDDVRAYLKEREVTIPKRTDCARCFHQRLSEWEALYYDHPEIYADAERQEEEFGHTFRSPSRDTKPAALKELKKHFPLKMKRDDDKETRCRVCSL